MPRLPNTRRRLPRNTEITAIDWRGEGVRGKVNLYSAETTMINDASPDSETTTYAYRKGVRADGTTKFWYYRNTGAPSTDQAIFDEIILADVAAGITSWMVNWYPTTAQLTAGGGGGTAPNIELIAQAHSLYLASPYKAQIKWCWMVTDGVGSWDSNRAEEFDATGGTWTNYDYFRSLWVTDFADGQYLKFDGKPVVGIFVNGTGPAWDADKITALRTSATNAGFPGAVLVQMNQNLTHLANLGLDVVTSYGPSGNKVTGNFGASASGDRTNWNAATAGKCLPGVTLSPDGRPRGAAASAADMPTFLQSYLHVRNGLRQACTNLTHCPYNWMMIYAANENAEGGALRPTAQGLLRSPVTGLGPVGAGIKHAKAESLPAQYTNHYHPAWTHAQIVSGGTWAITANRVGAHEFRVVRATAAASKTFTSTAGCTRVRAYGRREAGQGVLSCNFDSGGANNVDLATGGTGENLLIFDSGVVSAGVHTLAILWVSGSVDVDEIVETIG